MDLYLHTIEQIEQDLDRLIQEWALLKFSSESSDKAIERDTQDLREQKEELWVQIEMLNSLLQELYDEETTSSYQPNRVRPS